MKLTTIKSMNAIQPSWRIVREWDEILASELHLRLKSENKFTRFVKFNLINKNGFANFVNKLVLKSNKLSLMYVMTAETRPTCFVNKNTIPVIIDYWLKESELDDFYLAYKDVPLVLVTNLEVYRFLKEHRCPLNIEHWALSYPDRYKVNNDHEKKYEFCVFGRPNPFFIRMLDKYASLHDDFTYIMNNGDIENRQYIDHRGNIVAKDTGRSSYLDMISKTKISCYTTPGIDEAKKESSCFNQVTPRLFEMLCNGCMVIGHYPDSDDTLWYNLKSIVPEVDSYEDFEKVLDDLRAKSFDYEKVSSFIKKHYTSARAKELMSILNKYNISIN